MKNVLVAIASALGLVLVTNGVTSACVTTTPPGQQKINNLPGPPVTHNPPGWENAPFAPPGLTHNPPGLDCAPLPGQGGGTPPGQRWTPPGQKFTTPGPTQNGGGSNQNQPDISEGIP